MPLVFGAQWSAAASVLAILSFGGMLLSISHFNVSLLAALGRGDWYLRWTAANACLSIIAMLIGVQWSVEGVAGAFVLCRALTFPVSLRLARRLAPFSLRDYLRRVAGPLAAVAIMLASLALARPFIRFGAPSIDLVCLIAIGAGVYALGAYGLMRGTVREFRMAVLGGAAREPLQE